MIRASRSGSFSFRRSILWRAGAAVLAVQLLATLVIWWMSQDIAAAAIAFTCLPVCAAIVLIATRRLRAHTERLRFDLAAWEEGQMIRRPVRSTPLELALLSRDLREVAGRLQERMQVLAARQSEADAILQSMTSGVIALDLEQRIISANRAAERLLRLPPQRTRGRLLHEVVRQPEMHQLVSDALENGGDREVECSLPAGSRVQVRIERLHRAGHDDANDASDSAGRGKEPTGLLILLNDVTHIRRLESMRTDFAANVSHELRTPITNIKGYIETLIATGLEDRTQAQRFLMIIRHNTERLAAIVDDVMALTRLEETAPKGLMASKTGLDRPHASDDGWAPDARDGQAHLLPRQRDRLRPVLEAAVAQYQSLADAKSIRIAIEADADLDAFIHPPLLEQAIGNLISNAINYSPPQTIVRVAAIDGPDGAIEIAVSDQGPGIGREHHDRIFERFYRVDRGRSRDVGGTGLGLSIVKHIARAHGGGVSLKSEPGNGSTFRIVIPRESDRSAASDA